MFKIYNPYNTYREKEISTFIGASRSFWFISFCNVSFTWDNLIQRGDCINRSAKAAMQFVVSEPLT